MSEPARNPDGVTDDDALVLSLAQHAAAYLALGHRRSLYGYVLEHGESFEAGAWPGGWPRGKPKECFANAALATVRWGLRYVEGFGLRQGLADFPVHHAWCVNDDGVVLDPTWDNPQDCLYRGIVFPVEQIVDLPPYRTPLEQAVIESLEEQR